MTMNVKKTHVKKAIQDFWFSYQNHEGYLNGMTIGELEEYLVGDIFVACASAATGIPENDFAEHALRNVGNVYEGVA